MLSKNQESYFINRLSKEVGFSNVVVVNPFNSSELPESHYYIARTTGVYHSDNDLKLLGKIPSGKIFNPLSSLNIFRSKLSQYTWFDKNQFLALPYLDLQNADSFEVERFFALHGEVIIKPNYGQGGWGVRPVTAPEVNQVLSSSDRSYLLQPYVNDGLEVRYFFIKDRPPLIQKRTPTKGVAANFQSEGISEIIDLDPHYCREMDLLIKASGALYGAIDCFIRGNKIYFLELNTVPGIEQAEKISGRNLIEEFLPLFK